MTGIDLVVYILISFSLLYIFIITIFFFMTCISYTSAIAYGLNISCQKSTKMTPFYLMYLRHPPGIEMINVLNETDDSLNSSFFEKISDSTVEKLVNDCEAVEKKVRESIKIAQEKQCKQHMKKVAKKGIKTFTFKMNDQVMKLNARKRDRKGEPLSKEWMGPYTLADLNIKGQCTLKNFNGEILKTKVNVSQLKPYYPCQDIETNIQHLEATHLDLSYSSYPATNTVKKSEPGQITSSQNQFYIKNIDSIDTYLSKNSITFSVPISAFESILNQNMLGDIEINAAQVILKNQFPDIQGMQDTLLGTNLMFRIQSQEMLQILHDGSLHWLLISTLGCSDRVVKIYDSMKTEMPTLHVQKQIASIRSCSKNTVMCQYQSCQQQVGGIDCGLFAIAFAVDICMGQNVASISYNQSAMRQHLHNRFKAKHFTSFPRSYSESTVNKCESSTIFNVC